MSLPSWYEKMDHFPTDGELPEDLPWSEDEIPSVSAETPDSVENMTIVEPETAPAEAPEAVSEPAEVLVEPADPFTTPAEAVISRQAAPRRRLTDAERAVRRENARKRARYDAQEAKRAEPIQIDTYGTRRVLIVLVGISFLAAAGLLANATVDVASRIILPLAWMPWLAFGAIEVAVVIFMLGYLILGSKTNDVTGELQDATLWWKLMVFYSGITIASSGYHTLRGWGFEWTNPDMWAGFVLAVVIPLSYVLTVKLLSQVVFAKAISLAELGAE